MTAHVNRILIGVDKGFETITPSEAHLAFIAALSKLPASGGELYVFPVDDPTSTYRFNAPVSITQPDVSIRFAPGAVIDFGPMFSGSALFDVQAAGFRCHGAYMVQEGTSPAERSCFRVGDASTAKDSDGAVFEQCTFRTAQAV